MFSKRPPGCSLSGSRLFNRPGRDANYKASDPKVAELEEADEAEDVLEEVFSAVLEAV